MKLAKVYATNIQYTGKFEDNDKVELFYEGIDKWYADAEDVEEVERHYIKDKQTREYENMKEVRDIGNGTCTVYWCDVEDIDEEE